MILSKASTSQRFLAFFIDSILIWTIVSILTDLIYYIAGFDFSIIDVLLEKFLMQLVEIMEITEANGNATDQIIILQQYMGQIMKLYGIQLACSGATSLIVFILYMIVLPLKWSKQTIGRSIMKCKVVYPNVNGLDENKHKRGMVKAFFVRELIAGWLLYFMIGSLLVVIIAVIYYFSRSRTLADAISKTETISCIESINKNQTIYEESTSEDDTDAFLVDSSDYKKDEKTDEKNDDYIIF